MERRPTIIAKNSFNSTLLMFISFLCQIRQSLGSDIRSVNNCSCETLLHPQSSSGLSQGSHKPQLSHGQTAGWCRFLAFSMNQTS